MGEVLKSQSNDPEYSLLRMALTALISLRSFRLPPVVILDSITQEGLPVKPLCGRRLRDFFKRWGVSTVSRDNLLKVRWSKFHFTVRSGPSGPALINSLGDFLALPGSLRRNLEIMGGPLFSRVCSSLDRIAPSLHEEMVT